MQSGNSKSAPSADTYPEDLELPQGVSEQFREEWKRFSKDIQSQFQRLKGGPWNYALVPEPEKDPESAAKQQHRFDWKTWIDNLGPWIEKHLANAQQVQDTALATVLSDALEQWKWLQQGFDEQQQFTAENVGRCILLGRLVESLHAMQIESLVVTGRLREASRKVGQPKKRLTEEQEQLAIGIIQEKLRGDFTTTVAYTSAAAELKRRHNIDISFKTLARIWDKDKSRSK